MRPALKPRAATFPAPILVDRSNTVRWVGWLIVLYIVLLMVEGAFRKWLLPRYSDPILVIRDPVLLAIYVLAWRARVFPRNAYVYSLAVIGVLSLGFSLYFLANLLPWFWVAVITLYGFRANFLHMPLIFIIAKVFDEEDVKRIGWWILLGMIPLTLLMVAQFHASPESFINRTAGLGEAEQITAGGGKIRPPGTFSFISGPIFYCAMAAAFLLYGILARVTYKTWLLIASGVALVVAVAVSGSRGCVLSVALVVSMIFIIFIVRPSAVNQVGRILLIAVVAAFIIARLPVFKQGIDILSERFTSAAEEEQTSLAVGMLNRVAGEFTEGLKNLDKFPATGWGLGVGTNVGAHYLIGGPGFLLSENEWSRILYESGPFLGLAFILWRTILAFHIGYLSLKALKRGMTLPILLFSSAFFVLLNGQLGQPTTLGFAVVLAGLCLAAMQRARETTSSDARVSAHELNIPALLPKPLPRRSPYASRLHDSADRSDLVDR
jgi:hypothetical protein